MIRALQVPPFLALLVWSVVLAGFFFGPFSFTPQPAITTLMLIVSFVAVFTGSSLAGWHVGTMRENARAARRASSAPVYVRFPLNGVIAALSIGAIFGSSCFLIDRLMVTGLDGLRGFTEVRFLRAEEVAAATSLSRGGLTYLGYFFYPAAYLVSALGFLLYEGLSWRSRLLFLLNNLLPFAMAIVIGGRSPIFVLFLLILCAGLVRPLIGLPLVPRSIGLRTACFAAVMVFGLYTSIVWRERFDLTASTVEIALTHASDVWGIEPTAEFETFLDGRGWDDALLPALGAYFYLFQGPSIFQKLLDADSYPLLYGGFSIDIVAAAYRLFEPTREMLMLGYADLLKSEVYGFFPSAWGALLIDLSLLAFPFVAWWGWVSGATLARTRRSLGDAVMLIFVLYTVLISPISAPFGLANSFSIFFYFLAFKLWFDHRILRPVQCSG